MRMSDNGLSRAGQAGKQDDIGHLRLGRRVEDELAELGEVVRDLQGERLARLGLERRLHVRLMFDPCIYEIDESDLDGITPFLDKVIDVSLHDGTELAHRELVLLALEAVLDLEEEEINVCQHGNRTECDDRIAGRAGGSSSVGMVSMCVGKVRMHAGGSPPPHLGLKAGGSSVSGVGRVSIHSGQRKSDKDKL